MGKNDPPSFPRSENTDTHAKARAIYAELQRLSDRASVLGARRTESLILDARSEFALWCSEHGIRDPRLP